MKPRKDKFTRALNQAEVGRAVARLIDDADVMAVLDGMEEAAVEAMIAATSIPDREREALRIQVIRNFVSELKSKAGQVTRAEQYLQTESVTHA